MAFVAWLALAGGVLLIYAARKGTKPSETLRAVLRGEPTPPVAYPIGDEQPVPIWVEPDGKNSGSNPGGKGSARSGFIRPIAGRVTSGYGPRGNRMHYGIDIPAATGTPVRAAAPGHVTAAGSSGTAGIRVNLSHASGWRTKYHHFSRLAVHVGDEVAQGQLIGYVGATGNASGPHLHFETINPAGSHVDPQTVLPAV